MQEMPDKLLFLFVLGWSLLGCVIIPCIIKLICEYYNKPRLESNTQIISRIEMRNMMFNEQTPLIR